MSQLPKCDLVRRTHTYRNSWHLCHLLLTAPEIEMSSNHQWVFLLHVSYRLGNPMGMLWTGCIKLSLRSGFYSRCRWSASRSDRAKVPKQKKRIQWLLEKVCQCYSGCLAEVRYRILSKLDLEVFSTCWTQLTTVSIIAGETETNLCHSAR